MVSAQSRRNSLLLQGVPLLLVAGLIGFSTAAFSEVDDPTATAASDQPGQWADGTHTEGAVPYQAAIVMEPETETILYEMNAHRLWPPASMVKMMTGLLVLEHVRDGDLRLDESVTASRWAAQMGGSQVYLREGEVFTVRELLEAVMIHSANDAAVALAEHVAGSTEGFVDLMNDRASRLGLTETQYESVHGLPPATGQVDDLMSAYDLALLGRELLKHPEAVGWAATSQLPFRDGEFTLTNPNRLLRQFRGADGIKTGYHAKAGFCITASATRGDLRLIAVVLGVEQKPACFKSVARLLNRGFAQYRLEVPVRKGEPLGRDLPITGGVVGFVPLVASQDVRVLVDKRDRQKIQVKVEVPSRVSAPVQVGQPVGSVVVRLEGSELGRASALAARDVAEASLWQQWWPFAGP